MAISFNSVLIIAGIAVLVPVILGLLPRLPVPGAVLEVIAGIVVGPSVLGWVRVDAPVQVLSDLGLGMLLFLAPPVSRSSSRPCSPTLPRSRRCRYSSSPC